jgi:PQQ-dependent catabolism-associated CXXCW motif protein
MSANKAQASNVAISPRLAAFLRAVGIVAACTILATCAPATPWQAVQLTQPAYDGETIDYGENATSAIRLASEGYDAPTPTRIDGAKTITTPELRSMMVSTQPPILIDVIGGHSTFSLPGAIWLPGGGLGQNLHDGVQTRLATELTALTHGDKSKPLVFFCLSKVCWLSHNAAVRAVSLGYTNVYWYRGGRSAWQAAGLAMQPVQAATW